MMKKIIDPGPAYLNVPLFLTVAALLLTWQSSAPCAQASSETMAIDAQSINAGGTNEGSSSFRNIDSLGENVVGSAESEGYFVFSGFQESTNDELGAPDLLMSRVMTVQAPVPGGYSGGGGDAVPGAAISYSITCTNDGFASALLVVIRDKVPPFTEYKLGSATGEAVSITFSNDSGSSFNYVPSGSYVDADVTDIKWERASLASGASMEVSFEVVIK